jgi:hypothetical protein
MNNMENRTGSEPATRPETANPHNENPDDKGAGGNGSESGKPALSLVSDSPGHPSHVEDGFFAKGAADDKAALDMYAAMLPRGYSFKQINPRYLIMAGAAVLLLVGVAAGRHLPGGSQTQGALSPPAEASPAVTPVPSVPAPAAAVPAVPSPAPAAAVPVTPETPAPAPAPTIAAAPVVPEAPVAALAPTAATPTPTTPAELVAQPEAPAPAPTVAAAPAEQPAAQPDKATAPTPIVAAPAPEPQAAAEPAPKPAEAAPAEPVAEPVVAETRNVQACRDAIKKRDAKVVSASCESALTADASLAKPLLGFAKAQFEKGKSAQAAVWARKIIQVNGSLADAYLIMGAAEQEARHAAAAKTAYQRYLELAPRGPYADDVRSSLKSL